MSTMSKCGAAGGLWVVLGVAAFAPLQASTALTSVELATDQAGPATATSSPASLSVILRKSGGAETIVAPTDRDGTLRLSGLEAGDYTAELRGSSASVPMSVGLGGTLAIAVSANNSPPQLSKVEFEKGKGELYVGAKRLVDVSKASNDRLLEGTNNSNAAAALIIAERRANGAYRDLQDFSQRICSKTDLDFASLRIRIGNTMIVPRKDDPNGAGFQCTRGADELSIHGQRYQNVSKGLLLR